MLRRMVITLAAGVALGAVAGLPIDAWAFGGHGGGGMHGGAMGFHGGMGSLHGGIGHVAGNRFAGHHFAGHRFHHRFVGRRLFAPGLIFGAWNWGDGCWMWTPYGYRSLCY